MFVALDRRRASVEREDRRFVSQSVLNQYLSIEFREVGEYAQPVQQPLSLVAHGLSVVAVAT